MNDQEHPPTLTGAAHAVCHGGVAEPVNGDASRCPACGYTFTTVPNDPTSVPPHWTTAREEWRRCSDSAPGQDVAS